MGRYLDLGVGRQEGGEEGDADTQSFLLQFRPSRPFLPVALLPAPSVSPPGFRPSSEPRSALQGRCARPRWARPRVRRTELGAGRLAASLAEGPRGLLPCGLQSEKAKRRSQLDKQGFVTAAALIKGGARLSHRSTNSPS